MLPTASTLSLDRPSITSCKPKLGFSIDSLVGDNHPAQQIIQTPKQKKTNGITVRNLAASDMKSYFHEVEKHIAIQNQIPMKTYSQNYISIENENNKTADKRLENIHHALNNIHRNRTKIRQLSSQESKSPENSSPRSRTPVSPDNISYSEDNNVKTNILSPKPQRSTTSSPMDTKPSIVMPEAIHPLSSASMPISMASPLHNTHNTTQFINSLSFPPIGLPFAAFLPHMRHPQPSEPTHPPNNPPVNSPTVSSLSMPNFSASQGTSVFSNSVMAPSMLQHQSLPPSVLPNPWAGGGGMGLPPGHLGPPIMGPHVLGSPLSPARQYSMYPWLLARHNRLFGHRFPGKYI